MLQGKTEPRTTEGSKCVIPKGEEQKQFQAPPQGQRGVVDR